MFAVAGVGACADAIPDVAPSMAAPASKSFRIVIPPACAGVSGWTSGLAHTRIGGTAKPRETIAASPIPRQCWIVARNCIDETLWLKEHKWIAYLLTKASRTLNTGAGG